jgi:hypothetical protein
MGLFEAITFFQTQLSKILSQLEATLKVVRAYESVRLEYDGYRVVGNRTSRHGPTLVSGLVAQRRSESTHSSLHLQDYEKQKAADRNVEVAEAKFLDAYTKFQTSRDATMECLTEFDTDKVGWDGLLSSSSYSIGVGSAGKVAQATVYWAFERVCHVPIRQSDRSRRGIGSYENSSRGCIAPGGYQQSRGC